MIPLYRPIARTILLLLLIPAAGVTQELTEARAVQLLRESSRVRERRIRLASSVTSRSSYPARPGPSVNASFEGAGRTEFLFVEQEFMLKRRDGLAKRQENLANESERARADFDTGRLQSRMLAEFYRLVHARQRMQVIFEGIAEQERIGRAASALATAGEVSRDDVFLTEESVAELRVASAETEIRAARARAALADLLGDRVSAETLHAKGTLTPVRDLIPLHEALARALANRADLRSAAAALEASRLHSPAATRGWKPSIKLQGGIKRADVGDRLAIGPYVALSMPVPLGRGRHARERAGGSTEGLRREQLRVLRNQILVEVRVAHDTLRIRRTAADVYRETVLEPARELGESLLGSYLAGEANALDLLESVQARLRRELRSLELQAAAKTAEVEFHRVLGNPAP